MATRSSVVLIKDGQLLMVRQTYKGEELWTFPGGRIEADETPVQAAVREVYEETGFEVEIVDQLIEQYNDRIKGMYYCYRGIIAGGGLKLGSDPELGEQEQELKEVQWRSLEHLMDNIEVKRILPYIIALHQIENWETSK